MSLAGLLFSQIKHCRHEATLFRNVFTSSRVLRATKSPSDDAEKSKFGEEQIRQKLKSNFPEAVNINIVDVSGGCGAMYEVHLEDMKFKGLSIVKQHQLVNEALKEEIKSLHGIRISTSLPSIFS